MTAFTIFAIAITVSIFFHALLIKHKLPITLNTIVSSLSAVVGNVSSILSGATLLTILLEGADIMFFRRTREEYAKLKKERAEIKEEKRELEELKKEIEDLQNGSQAGQTITASQGGQVVSKPGNVKSDTKPTEPPEKPENPKPKS